MSRPVVVIPACTTLIDGYVFDAVGRKYYGSRRRGRGMSAFPYSGRSRHFRYRRLLEVADAILLTGSRSNVAPEHYGEETPLMPDGSTPCATR